VTTDGEGHSATPSLQVLVKHIRQVPTVQLHTNIMPYRIGFYEQDFVTMAYYEGPHRPTLFMPSGVSNNITLVEATTSNSATDMTMTTSQHLQSTTSATGQHHLLETKKAAKGRSQQKTSAVLAFL
jgi:hypothetical protein